MNYYKDERILKQAIARLVPPNEFFSDCMCELLLTDQHFYALEDDFEGAYTEHFAIHKSRIITMEKVFSESSSKISSSGNSTGNYIATALVGLVGGVIVLPEKDHHEKVRKTYLKVTFADVRNQSCTVFFTEFGQNINSFIKAFMKNKKSNDY